MKISKLQPSRKDRRKVRGRWWNLVWKWTQEINGVEVRGDRKRAIQLVLCYYSRQSVIHRFDHNIVTTSELTAENSVCVMLKQQDHLRQSKQIIVVRDRQVTACRSAKKKQVTCTLSLVIFQANRICWVKEVWMILCVI